MEIGDKIIFNNYKNCSTVPKYYTDIPRDKILHGSTVQLNQKDGGIIEDFYQQYVIISFIDCNGKKSPIRIFTQIIHCYRNRSIKNFL